MNLKKKILVLSIASAIGMSYGAPRIVALVLNKAPLNYEIIPSGVIDPPTTPVFVKPNFVQMFYGKNKMALDDTGTIWEGDSQNRWMKTSISGVSKISVSPEHAVALKGGKLLVKGTNNDGQLGTGDTSSKFEWYELVSISGVTDILASGGDDGCTSYYNTFYIAGGNVYSTGSDVYSQLGRDGRAECGDDFCSAFGLTTMNNAKSLEGGADYIFALTNSNELYTTWSYNWPVVDEWEKTLSNVTELSVGPHDVMALSGSKVYSAGQSVDMYLSNQPTSWKSFIETPLSNPTDIATFGSQWEADGMSSFALFSGELYVLGDNSSGQMGLSGSSQFDDWVATGITDIETLYDDGGESVYVRKSDGDYYYPENGDWVAITFLVDSDGDGVSDEQEIIEGTNPNDDQSFISQVIHPTTGSVVYDMEDQSFVKYYDDGGKNSDYSYFYNNGNEINSTITFITTSDKILNIKFNDYHTENYDLLKLYDGNSDSEPLLKTCSSTDCKDLTFSSSTNSLTFNFTADFGVLSGWDATVSVETIDSRDTDNDGIINHRDLDDDNDGYSDVLELDEGTDPLDKDSYPQLIIHSSETSVINLTTTVPITYYDDGLLENYSNSINSATTITPPSGYALKVDFSDFETESGYDYFSVYNGKQKQAENLIKKCDGSKCLNESFTSYALDGSLTFNFKSDGSATELGWVGDITFIDQSTLDFTDTDSDGIVNTIDKDDDGDGYLDELETSHGTDPLNETDYPNIVLQPSSGSVTMNVGSTALYYDNGGLLNSYTDKSVSNVTMVPPSGHYIEVTFNSFDTSSGDGYFKVYGGGDNGDYLFGIYDGNQSIGPFVSNNEDGRMTFGFSAGWDQGTGWDASVATYPIVDSDGDGVPNHIENNVGTNPNDISDVPSNVDSDLDGTPDYADGDNDNDGYPDYVENLQGTNSLDNSDAPNCTMSPGSGSGDGNNSGGGSCF